MNHETKICDKVAELSNLENDITTKIYRQNSAITKNTMQGFFLTLVLLALLGFLSQIKAQQPAYVAETRYINGQKVEVYSRTTTDKTLAQIGTAIKGVGTDANTHDCSRQMIWYKNAGESMDAVTVKFHCNTRITTYENIESGEYIVGGFPIQKDEIAILTIEKDGQTIDSHMISPNTATVLRKVKIVAGSDVNVVIKQQD